MTGAIYGAVIGGAISFVKSVGSIRKANKKVIENFNKQLGNINRNYSYAQNDLDKSAVNAYDSALYDIYQNSLTAFRNTALVESALAESGLEGRSQSQVMRDVRGQSERQNDAVQSSYENAIYSIKSSKDALYVEYKDNVENLREATKGQFTKGISGLMKIADATAQGAAIGYFTGGLGGSFASGFGSTATSSAGAAFGGATVSNAGSILYSGSASSALSAGSASFGGATVANAGSTLMGSTASSSLGASFGGATVSNAGSILYSGASSSWLSSLGSNLSSGWNRMMTDAPTWYANTNRYLNYYKAFRNAFTTDYYKQNRQYRRGYYAYD